MMGSKARIFTPITAVSLEELVPANHFYRHLDRVVDLSFVRDLVKETYAERGRTHGQTTGRASAPGGDRSDRLALTLPRTY